MNTPVLTTAGLIAITIVLSTKSGSADQAKVDLEGRSAHDSGGGGSPGKFEFDGRWRRLRWRTQAFDKAIRDTQSKPIKVGKVTLPVLRVYKDGPCTNRPLIILIHGCP